MTYTTPAAIVAISILFPVLGIVVVGLRFYTRRRANVSLWVDDWLTIPALLLEFIIAALLIWGATTHSLGGQLPSLHTGGPNDYLFSTSDQQIRLQQIQYFVDIAAVLSFGSIKLSILFFYRRVFCDSRMTTTVFELVNGGTIALVLVWTTAFTFGSIFLCGAHPSYAWATVAVVAEKCHIQTTFLEACAISDLILDAWIWSLPLPKIFSLHMTVRRKSALATVFLVGLLAIAASATRMAIYIIYVVDAFAHSDGETIITYLMFWTMIESGLSLIVVCLPALRPLMAKAPGFSLLDSIRSTLSLRSFSRQQLIGKDLGQIDSFTGTASSKPMHHDGPGHTSEGSIELLPSNTGSRDAYEV